MLWLWLALGTAALQAVKDVYVKRSVAGVRPVLAAWVYAWAAAACLAPAVWIQGPPGLGSGFWPALSASVALNALATLLYFRALAASDMSLTVPMLTLTPVLLLWTSPLMLGEHPSTGGLAGVLLAAAGSYVLKLSEARRGWLAPLRSLLAERGPRRMLLVAVIWSVSANLDKMGLARSSPLCWLLGVFAGVGLALTPAALRALRADGPPSRRRLADAGLAGLFEAGSTALQMLALTLAIVPYVIAVKRTSAVFGVLLGSLVFGERGLRERLAGVLLMLAGVFCIALL
ncbi:MAG: DMT family transporter [Thermodesulfobacteriota bacterium]